LFLTMLPALDLLLARGARLELDEAWQYFWATGLLSSFLDNAPTYLVFLALAQAQGLAPEVVGVPHEMLTAISLGAVFMGANTYIGNGPNFMVRAIAENRGIQMPGFGRLHALQWRGAPAGFRAGEPGCSVSPARPAETASRRRKGRPEATKTARAPRFVPVV
jgi:hypothetical protein